MKKKIFFYYGNATKINAYSDNKEIGLWNKKSLNKDLHPHVKKNFIVSEI